MGATNGAQALGLETELGSHLISKVTEPVRMGATRERRIWEQSPKN